MRYKLLYRAVTRYRHRFAAFAVGATFPLVGAGMVLAVQSGGLSDSPSGPPPAYVVDTFD